MAHVQIQFAMIYCEIMGNRTQCAQNLLPKAPFLCNLRTCNPDDPKVLSRYYWSSLQNAKAQFENCKCQAGNFNAILNSSINLKKMQNPRGRLQTGVTRPWFATCFHTIFWGVFLPVRMSMPKPRSLAVYLVCRVSWTWCSPLRSWWSLGGRPGLRPTGRSVRRGWSRTRTRPQSRRSTHRSGTLREWSLTQSISYYLKSKSVLHAHNHGLR